MRVEEFKIGDKVVVPPVVIQLGRSRYATVEYIGSYLTVLKSEVGTEFTVTSDLMGFRRYRTEEDLDNQITRLTVLGRDLIAAIDLAIPHHLPSKTGHMESAINNFRDELLHV